MYVVYKQNYIYSCISKLSENVMKFVTLNICSFHLYNETTTIILLIVTTIREH